MAVSCLGAARDVGEEISRDLEVALRTGEPDMPQVDRERGQDDVEIGSLAIPQGEPTDRKRVPQIVQAQRASLATMRDLRHTQDVMERGTQCGDGIRGVRGRGEERHVRLSIPELRDDMQATRSEPRREIGSDWHDPRLAELGVAHMHDRLWCDTRVPCVPLIILATAALTTCPPPATSDVTPWRALTWPLAWAALCTRLVAERAAAREPGSRGCRVREAHGEESSATSDARSLQRRTAAGCQILPRHNCPPTTRTNCDCG